MNAPLLLRLCCRCLAAPAKRQDRSSYCLGCHAAAMRKWRANHPYETRSAVERFKSTVRSIANVHQRRGRIAKTDCILCDRPSKEKHHPDYSDPLLVVWLCRDCHLRHHKVAASHVKQFVELLAQQWDAQRKRSARYLRQQMSNRIAMRKLRNKYVKKKIAAALAKVA